MIDIIGLGKSSKAGCIGLIYCDKRKIPIFTIINESL